MVSESTNLIKATYFKSAIGYSRRQKDTVRSLGLKHLGDTAVHEDCPPIRGMLNAVCHLVSAEPVSRVDVVMESGN